MLLALIPPIGWLSTSEVTNYQLMLPHLVQDHIYSRHYDRLCKREDQYVILDNGEAEGQNYLSSAQLVGVGVYFRVNEIVVPDVIGDSIATLNRMKQFFKDIHDLRNDAFGPNDVARMNYMGVVQGRSRKEAQDCIDMMMELYGDKLKTLALPRHLLQSCDNFDTRLDLAQYIFHNYTGPQGGIQIHCLGASHLSAVECLYLAKQGIVRGMDTSMPYNWAFHGKYLNEDLEIIKRPDRYFTQRNIMFRPDALHHNIGVMRRWANGED